MTGELTTKIVQKAHKQIRTIVRDYMAFTAQMECVRIVLNPQTLQDIHQEFWEEERKRSLGSPGSGFWVGSATVHADKPTSYDDRMLGIRVMDDPTVPPGEVELRAVLNKSWESAL